MGHELHHCARHSGPGYGDSLKEVLVSEGLACHFETELRNGAVPFYAASLSEKSHNEMYERILPELESNKFNYRAWFFGSDSLNIPRHTGYTVGFKLVEKYITKKGTPASKLWSIAAEEIVK